VQHSVDGHGVQHSVSPGKRTLTEGLAADRRETEGLDSAPASAAPITARAGALPRSVIEGSPLPLQMLFGVRPDATAAPAEDPASVHAAATRGAATPATKLPCADQIQGAFGRHDISGIQAHLGADATASAREMGAQAYAMGNHVVLGDGADLHTVAHEAAHVIQQRGGVQLTGGVGAVGDRHEQHADEVADRVVQGRSAETLLDAYAPGAGKQALGRSAPSPGGGAVQGKWSHMTTLEQQDKPTATRIANLAGQGDHVAAFRELLTSTGGGLLARFNAAVTAYTSAGRLQIVTAALQSTFVAPGQSYTAQQVLDEVEGGISAQLQQLFAARNVIVAGETHNDAAAHAMETMLLPAHNIQVRHEPDTLQAPGGDVTPGSGPGCRRRRTAVHARQV
jgi:hypothetical protein